MNRRFQEYKECKVVLSDDVKLDFKILPAEIVFDKKGKIYNRAKEKEETRKIIEEEVR